MSGWGPKVIGGGSGGGGGLTYPNNTILPDPAYSTYNEISSVASGSWVDILVYVVPASPVVHIVRIEYGGENIAKYRLLAGASVEARDVKWFGDSLTGRWEFVNSDGGGLRMAAGTVVKVQVNHRRIGNPADFFARLQWREIN